MLRGQNHHRMNVMRMNVLGNRARIDVRTEAVSLPEIELPFSLNERLDKIRPTVREMREEAPEHLVYQAAVYDQCLQYVLSAPGTSIATATCCAGAGVSVSGSAVYYIPRHVGAHLPAGGSPVVKATATTSEEQGRITAWGRMGGPFGWSADRDLIAGALASFTHNWVGMLALFRDRPKLPQVQPWVLPNVTLAETKAPNQLVLPASYSFRLLRPALMATFDVIVKSDTPAKMGFDWWDPGKGDLARVEAVDLPAGDNRVILSIRGPPPIYSGFFNVNPIDAPAGVTVASVRTTPMSV